MARAILLGAILCIGISIFLTGCGRQAGAQGSQDSDTGPHPGSVEFDTSASHFKVDHPEKFPLATAKEYAASRELNVTGVVSPDVSRQVPVIALTSGRIVEIDARLGDTVRKGKLLFKVRSTDISGAFSDYRKAVINEQLAKVQLDRSKILYEDGAIPKSALEVAQNAEDDALVDLETTTEHLRLLGSDPQHPSGIVPVYAPVSGIITDQEITGEAGVQALNSPSPFTISDISRVWLLCDVYENDLAQVHLGEYADVHLNAYPERAFKARIANVGPVLDPTIRTAKVRLELVNPGLMRLGMFATATFRGLKKEDYAMVPASAILHLHDREWVYTPADRGYFERREVVSGNMLPDHMQEVMSGLGPGTQVVANALDLQHTVSQ